MLKYKYLYVCNGGEAGLMRAKQWGIRLSLGRRKGTVDGWVCLLKVNRSKAQRDKTRKGRESDDLC